MPEERRTKRARYKKPAQEWMPQIEGALQETLQTFRRMPCDKSMTLLKTIQEELNNLRGAMAQKAAGENAEENLEDALDEFEEEEEPTNQALDFGDELEKDYNTLLAEGPKTDQTETAPERIERQTRKKTSGQEAEQPITAEEENELAEPSPAYVSVTPTEPTEPEETPSEEITEPQEKKSTKTRHGEEEEPGEEEGEQPQQNPNQRPPTAGRRNTTD